MIEQNIASQLDEIETRIMSGLKNFQRATVERIDQLYRSGKMRVLVSDEVGLGKTLIARGTIAKLAKLRKEQGDDLVKVVYICSNVAIASQNLDKLKITKELQIEATHSSRLSMQHLNIFNQENDTNLLNRYIQLIPLTPSTSFRMTTGTGTVNERALMFTILNELPELSCYYDSLKAIMIDRAFSSWNWAEWHYKTEVNACNDKSKKTYLPYMIKKLSKELNATDDEGTSYLDVLISLCESREKNETSQHSERYIIGKLRIIFAKISLEKLEPDLVIMDEFQRFKYLINSKPDSETGLLTNKFFNSNNVKMLLLSATPYKMYSTLDEIDDTQLDEHYSEFFDVMDFLNITKNKQDDFRTIWNHYSIQLKEFSKGNTTIISAKHTAENAMYENICRTERIATVANADMIDDKDVFIPLSIVEQDIKPYIQIQQLLNNIGLAYSVPVNYVKSSPYLMSFMRNYKLKKDIESYFSKHPNEVKKANKNTLWLKNSDFKKYEKIPKSNARLQRVLDHTFKDKVELLLWVPPSRPYYPPQGVYKGIENFSKSLIFSSWEMVPRMIAGLLSYEAERTTVGKLAKERSLEKVNYFNTGDKRYPSARLNFSTTDGKANAMSLFCLIYPSQFLTTCYEPVAYLNKDFSLNAIKKEIKIKIQKKIATTLGYHRSALNTIDKRWYFIAPLLLDDENYVTAWLDKFTYEQNNLDEDDTIQFQKGLTIHLTELYELYNCIKQDGGTKALGKKPADLLDVLADIAIASPAVAVNRTYQVYSKKALSFCSSLPSYIAKIFLNRMNSTESTAIVELACGKKSHDAHWQDLLTYCKHGNIQAMFDEYAHVISNGLDKDDDLVHELHKYITKSIKIRTTTYTIDTFNALCARLSKRKSYPMNIRSHFAVAFTEGDEQNKTADRKKIVRDAFNSPFRPFILASTSIGQEGLDFHNYCRKIIHWNLPSNPIDLEQREGRINRFESLAIRQNLAKRYGSIKFSKNVWAEMLFEAQEKENGGKCSHIIPFWGLTKQEDMIKIERIVPMYPFSKDGLAYERLIKILSLYRLTLGQARQEELLEYVIKNYKKIDDIQKLFINLSPYHKKKL